MRRRRASDRGLTSPPLYRWRPLFAVLDRARPDRYHCRPFDKAPVAQLDRALPSEGRGRRFESCRARQFSCFISTPYERHSCTAVAVILRLWEICGRNPRTWVPPCSGQMVNTLSGTNDLESGSTRSSREPGDFHSISRRCSVATRGRTRQNYPREPQQPLFLG